MDETIRNQALSVLKKIESPSVQDAVATIRKQDPTEELRKEVLDFFKNRISSIKKSEELKELVYSELRTQIQGGQLSFDQLMSVLSRLDHGANDSADSIISMFRPNATGTSMLTDLVRPAGETGDLARAFAQYSSEDLQAIEKTMHTLRVLTESQKEQESDPILNDSEEL